MEFGCSPFRCVRISKMQDTEDETGLQLGNYPII